jgi:UDP-GlcNAc:undecaprenyl-phosphate GlcNAc-1-phosphate transferase
VPAVTSAVLVGICAGFLPHNFSPARIFMGDTGAMLIGLLLAYGPISSTLSLDPDVLSDYSLHPLNRFPQVLPILLPVAILVIPYTDLALAVIRRTARGKSPFAPDRKHLHHRLLNMGHSHRQSVLLMYLWAALFSGAVVGLSVVRIQVVWLAAVTLAALTALVLATIPQLRPWHTGNGKHGTVTESAKNSDRVAYAGPDPRTVNGLAAHGVLAPPATLPSSSSNALVDPTQPEPAVPAGEIKNPPSSLHR